MATAKTIHLKVRRQDAPDAPSRWEDFRLPYRPNMNVISCLQDIQANPVNAHGERTTPVTWECGCLEEVCGACSMVINGKARQSCTALVDQLEQPIVLEPFTKFPVVRDLIVDRSRMFETLKRVHAWIPIDGTYALGEGPRMAEHVRQRMYTLSTCMTCGCCLEVCPQVNERSEFIGAAAISQVRLFNSHPTGAMHAHERLDSLMEPGGIQDCGNAQNCVKACPKEIPLTESIADVGRQMTGYSVKKLLGLT
ncbi:MAG: succinate dehydrogenase iron-sulfur subunit [Candidatus Methylomirabilis sp.]|nr:succinate dehydrogenase iron-sulfur subunit [Deltaproteobacteria bacterium]